MYTKTQIHMHKYAFLHSEEECYSTELFGFIWEASLSMRGPVAQPQKQPVPVVRSRSAPLPLCRKDQQVQGVLDCRSDRRPQPSEVMSDMAPG